MSAEATVVRNYLDWLLSIPWGIKGKVKKDLDEAQTILDAEHYGLDKVKERIVEYLAVQARMVQPAATSEPSYVVWITFSCAAPSWGRTHSAFS
jgi:ATP-dependent Lon protease